MELAGGAILALAACRLALRHAPVSTLAAALTMTVLLGAGAINPSHLPLASEVSTAADAVESWQQTQANKGACYIRETRALQRGDEATLEEIAADCQTG